MRRRNYLSVGLVALLAACQSPQPADSPPGTPAVRVVHEWSAAQTAHVAAAMALAAVAVADSAAQASGTSTLLQAQILTGQKAVGAATLAATASLQAGQPLDAVARTAIMGAVTQAVGGLGAILRAAHGSTANLDDVLLSACEGALQSLPAVLPALPVVNGGLEPSAADLAADRAQLQAILARPGREP